MKILLFIDSLGGGGAQRQLVGLAKMLKSKKFDVTVAVYHDVPFFSPQLKEAHIAIEIIKGNYFNRIFGFFNLAKSMKPDWVISYLESPSMIACLVNMFRHYKLIVSERNTSQCIDGKTRLRFKLFHMAKFVVPNSFSQGEFIACHAPYLKHKTTVISNFVDTDYFTPDHVRFKQEKQEILVAASIWSSKNTLKFIDAIRILSKQNHNFHVSWYGKTKENLDYFNECQNKIDSKGLGKYITLLDKTQNIRAKYQEADLFCLPSFYEGTPNVIGEAMACGLPIVCSNVCDNPIYVREDENGFLFDPNSPNEIAEKLLKALSLSENEYKSYSNSSRKCAEKLLSKDAFLNKYLKLFENA